MTGDVFAGIGIPGVERIEGDDQLLAMIVSHPCSMRDGHELRPAPQALRVVRSAAIDLTAWKQHFDRMPLPNLQGRSGDDDTADSEDFYAALFEMRGRVPTTEINLDNRVACLSEEGVGFLHQRMGHADTRFAPRVADLVESCASPFAEAELAEEWNTQLLTRNGELDSLNRDEVLLRAAKDFDEVLSELRRAPSPNGKKQMQYRLRDDLGLPKKRPGVRREIAKIIKQRQAEDDQATV
ncbi:hypothetical protein [Micromonospora humida]|uniref:Uncharacterized protein n=1 Tax=Micromonospora humida TaxID=2809018 RepID=A0ABS2IYM8_9ACTN|nr:hypothetical protein [Micromonospora humida]MBM7079179.1 hypothetical protein [Micromonospora humida]